MVSRRAVAALVIASLAGCVVDEPFEPNELVDESADPGFADDPGESCQDPDMPRRRRSMIAGGAIFSTVVVGLLVGGVLDRGDATWTLHTIIAHDTGTAKGADGFAVGDYNGDGKVDVLSAFEQGNRVWVARGEGGGEFTPILLPLPVAGQGSMFAPEDARFGDVDGDGDLDVLVAESGSAKLRWYPNNGTNGSTPFDAPVKIAEGTQCSANTVTCKYMHVALLSPGVVFAGSYSTGASVARFNCNDNPCTTTSAWTRTELTTAGWVKGLEIHDGDDLWIWDESGANRGVHRIADASVGTGTNEAALECTGSPCRGPIDTLRGTKVGSTIVYPVGSADGQSAGARIKVVGGPDLTGATYPANFGRIQAVNVCDINGDGVQDLVATASHATTPTTAIVESDPATVLSVVWLEGPDYTTAHDVSGLAGIKHDNAVCLDFDEDGDLDIGTTEEKFLGLIWYENPRL